VLRYFVPVSRRISQRVYRGFTLYCSGALDILFGQSQLLHGTGERFRSTCIHVRERPRLCPLSLKLAPLYFDLLSTSLVFCLLVSILIHPFPSPIQLNGLDGACATTLQYLNLENNTLNGTVPSVLPTMTSLQWALFGHNAFSGFLPSLPSSASKYSFWGIDTVSEIR